jgi:predicted nucleotidyltransferase
VTSSSVQTIIQALNEAGVRYLVVGGLAVVAHGHVRFTADLDLVLDFNEENLRRAMEVFESLGFRPRAPVPLRKFAETEIRQGWIRDKGLTVLSLFSDDHPLTEVDLFVADPFGFDQVYTRRVTMAIAPHVEATFVGLDDLVRMKKVAGRPQDLSDIEQLEDLSGERDND